LGDILGEECSGQRNGEGGESKLGGSRVCRSSKGKTTPTSIDHLGPQCAVVEIPNPGKKKFVRSTDTKKWGGDVICEMSDRSEELNENI